MATADKGRKTILIVVSILLIAITTASIPVIYHTIKNSIIQNNPMIDGDKPNEDINQGVTTKETFGGQYTVVVKKSFFYGSPDLQTKGRAYVLINDVLTVSQSSGNFVNATFTSSSGRQTTGWILLSDLQKKDDLGSEIKLNSNEYGEFSFQVPCGARGWYLTVNFISNTNKVSIIETYLNSQTGVSDVSKSNGTFTIDKANGDFKYVTCYINQNQSFQFKYSVNSKKWILLNACDDAPEVVGERN